MRKHDIAGILAIMGVLAFSGGMAGAETSEPPLNPADVPSCVKTLFSSSTQYFSYFLHMLM